MLLYPETKVYVLCPGNNRSDAAERCHQLCSQLLRLNVETYMVYLPSAENFDEENPVDESYKKYYVPYDSGVEDDAQNILIVPEIAATYLYLTRNARRILWWVDVDGFFRDIAVKTVDHMENLLAEPMPRFFSFNRFDNDVEHWAQSEYARQFLKVNGVPDERIYDVGDYLTQEFFAAGVGMRAKKNLVAYRPIKGRDFTDVVKDLSDVEWLPVENMAPEVAQKLFARAKVYVDFGDFPSIERLVREAAVSNCVIITGKRGAAGNDVDINIPAEFKFDETIDGAVEVAAKIKNIMQNFKAELAKQNDFREKVLRERELFTREISSTFGVKPSEKIAAGIIGGLSDVGIKIAELLFQQDGELMPKFIIDNADDTGENIIHEQNRSYLNLSDEHKLQIISGAESKFLYGEGRLQKFIVTSNVKPNFAAAEDIIEPNFEEDGDE